MWLALGGAAHGNIARPSDNPAELGAPTTDGDGSPLRVVAQDLTITCAEAARRTVACRFRSEYVFENPGEGPVELAPVFVTVDAADVAVEVASAAVPATPLDGERLAAYRHGMHELIPHWDTGHGGQVVASSFPLAVAPRAQVTVVVTGRLIPDGWFRPSYALPGHRARHMVVTRKPGPKGFTVGYLIAPLRTWGDAPTVRVRVETPRGWRARVMVDDAEQPPGQRELAVDGDTAGRLAVHLQPPAQRVVAGGPLVAIGGAVAGAGGFRMRAGYELGFPDRWLAGVAVDTDFDDHLAVAAVARYVTPAVLIIPSLGAGVGVPVLLGDGTDVGVRAELDLHYPALGFVMTFDYYLDAGFQMTLLGQLSL